MALKILAAIAACILLTPIGMVIVAAVYMVYSPKINSYNVITECDVCSKKDTPYCAKCWRCKWNPLYWVHKQLIYNGPSRRLRRWLAEGSRYAVVYPDRR